MTQVFERMGRFAHGVFSLIWVLRLRESLDSSHLVVLRFAEPCQGVVWNFLAVCQVSRFYREPPCSVHGRGVRLRLSDGE